MTSFDLNYRAKLWNLWGGSERAQSILTRIVENVDVLVGNEEDLQLGLGIPGPKVDSKPGLEADSFIAMMGEVTGAFPNIKVAATTLRKVHSTNHHSWGAVAWVDGNRIASPTVRSREIPGRPGWATVRATSIRMTILPVIFRRTISGRPGSITIRPSEVSRRGWPGG